jgi:8-oxo-dGTP pyrophosphatase MutT (NUDIX family)
MDKPRIEPTFIERLRTRVFLFTIGVWRHMTLGVRAVLLRDGQVLLIRHTYVPGWQFPGGGVEPGETAEASMAREVAEEACYEVIGPSQLFGLYFNRANSDRDHVSVYVCRNFSPIKTFVPTNEIAAAQWFDLDDLPADVTPATRRRLDEIADNRPPAAEW